MNLRALVFVASTMCGQFVSAAAVNLISDGSFERFSHTLGIVADPASARAGQVDQASFFGTDTWYLQPRPGIPGGGSVDVVDELLGYGVSGGVWNVEDSIIYGNVAIDLIGTPYAGALNQRVVTELGQRYRFSMALSSNQQHEQPGAATDRAVDLYINGSIVLTANAGSMGEWIEHSYEFVADTTETKIGILAHETIGAQTSGDSMVAGIQLFNNEPVFGPVLDNVRLTAVPEPSAFTLWFFAMGVLMLKRRRRVG